MKGSKGSKVEYDSLSLQENLNPYANIPIEDQRYLFSLRCEVNPLRTNFRRNSSMKEIYCVKSCQTELDNGHLVYCQELNSNLEIHFARKKLEALPALPEKARSSSSN